MGRVLIVTALLGLALAGHASADSAGAPPTPAVAATPVSNTAAPEKKDPMVCRMTAAMTGSRLGGHRMCMKASEWKEREDLGHQTLQAIQQQSLQSDCTPAMKGC